jgi:hypothetical protein
MEINLDTYTYLVLLIVIYILGNRVKILGTNVMIISYLHLISRETLWFLLKIKIESIYFRFTDKIKELNRAHY